MFRPVSFWLSYKYIRAPQNYRVVSLTALSSCLGLALGIAVLITVLSVMNGFDYEIHQRMLKLVRQVSVVAVDGDLIGHQVDAGSDGPLNTTRLAAVSDSGSGVLEVVEWQEIKRQVETYPQVEASAPALVSQGMLSFQGRACGVLIEGVMAKQERQVSELPSFIVEGHWKDFDEQEFGIVVGMGIANRLGVVVGDSVTLIVPSARITPLGLEPRMKRFKIAGIFRVGNGFSHDNLVVYTRLLDLNKLLRHVVPFNRVHLKLRDVYQTAELRDQLNRRLPEEWYASDWTQEYGAFFQAIRMEKNAMFLLLMLIIAVASFNLVAGLTVMVTNKRREIALLRTLGFSQGRVIAIFVGYGGMVGIMAMLVGTLLGLILTWQAANIVEALEGMLHQRLFNADVYLVDNLPVRLLWQDVAKVDVLAFLLTLLSTIYPAWKSSKITPVQAMRYE